MKLTHLCCIGYFYMTPFILFCVYRVRGDSLSLLEYGFIALQFAWCIGPLMLLAWFGDKEIKKIKAKS